MEDKLFSVYDVRLLVNVKCKEVMKVKIDVVKVVVNFIVLVEK